MVQHNNPSVKTPNLATSKDLQAFVSPIKNCSLILILIFNHYAWWGMYVTTYFEANFWVGTVSKTTQLLQCCSTYNSMVLHGSPWFARVKPACGSSFCYRHGKPVNPGHDKLPEFIVLPLCSSRYCLAAASVLCSPSLSVQTDRLFGIPICPFCSSPSIMIHI